MFLAIAPVFPGPVYLICQNTFRIITGTLSESFYCFNQAGALVVCLERYFFDTPITFAVKTEIKFCIKFNRCFDLASDDRPEPWLRNTYNAVLHRMNSVIIHILLLFIQPDDGKIQTDILTCHGITFTHELFQLAKISFYVAKLSAECTADFLCRVLPTLSKCKILFSGTFTVSSWQFKTITFTKTVNHVFQLFSCFVQK